MNPLPKRAMRLETLEGREVPAAVAFAGPTVFVTGTAAADSVKFDSGVLTVNCRTFSLAGITDAVVSTGAGDDDIENNTSINLTALAGRGDDRVFGGTGRNTIDLGAGDDVGYSLVGATVITGGSGADRIYVNALNVLGVDSDKRDLVVRFFDKGRVPGSGRAELDNGVLYLTPSGAIRTEVFQVKSTVFVQQGTQLTSFDARSVRSIAYFGDGANNTFVNRTSTEEAAYGAGGDDTIVSGTGKFNLLKGSGGQDTLIARGRRADVSSNGGGDTIILFPYVDAKLRTRADDTVIRL